MLEGLNSAAAGMAAQQQRMDAASNDLANANTTGYKSVRVGFQDLLYTQADRSSAQGVRIGAGAKTVDAGRTWAQGSFQATDQPLDVAINGEGFLHVRLPNGQDALTRDGDLSIDGLGRLTTTGGALVLSHNKPISVPKGTAEQDIAIAADGTVLAAGRRVGRMDLMTVRSPNALTPVGDNAFTTSSASGPAVAAPRTSSIQQGVLEASNVDMADAMVALIESQRSYQLASKAITTADEMMGIANQVKR
jgi:flagellar basal-body rod protein FlgG